MFKPRSKSSGRSPSRSFKDEEKPINVYTDEEIVDSANKNEKKLERIEILSDLTNELDKPRICGENLDGIVSNLIKKYSENERSSSASNIFLNLNTCRDRVNISPPNNLSILKKKKIDLDRLAKLQRIFASIPVFSNAKDFTIRDLLNGLNHICEGLGFEVNSNEFEILLFGKLGPKIKSAIKAYQHDSLPDLYKTLLNLYDQDYSKKEAFSAIMNCKKNFSSLHEFTEHILHLLSLSQKSLDEQSRLFVHSLEGVFPPRITEKINDFVETFETLNNGDHPLLPNIVDMVYKYKGEIDAFMSKGQKSKAMVFNVLQTEDDNGDKLERFCTICQRSGHDNAACFKTKTCQNCYKTGHIDKYCKSEKFCSICQRKGHVASSCFSRCRLCNEKSHKSVECPKYKGQEPSQEPCSKCLAAMFIKLYHPSSKCKSFNTKN